MLPLRTGVNKLIPMTGNKVLLDTNIVSALLKGEISIADKIDLAEQVYVPNVVIGELHYGAQYSSRIKKNIEKIIDFSERYDILKIDATTAATYGRLKAALRKKGKPIPENDIWIAALAEQYQLPLATRDRHLTKLKIF
jgi:tRNA(fMet)-specific endonuclease VapC